MDMHERLVAARRHAKFGSAADAAKALGVNYATYAGHENGSSGFKAKTGELYARRFKVSFEWLMSGRGSMLATTSDVRAVRVVAHVQAGDWAESWEWPYSDQYDVAVPNDPEYAGVQLFAAETRGPSMNRRWPEGTVVVFVDNYQLEESPIPGKRYVVERTRADGRREHTVKTLHRDESGQFWLIPESTDPLFQSPISIEDGDGGNEVRIVGRVCYAVTRE